MLDWSYIPEGQWIAQSSHDKAWTWCIEVTEVGSFDVGGTSAGLMPRHKPHPFTTLGLAKAWCQAAEESK